MTTTMRDPVSPDLRKTLRALKLGQMLATLPERLTLARQQKMTHTDFLELVLADEVTRREAKSGSQVCDLVQIRTSPAGTAIRLHMHLKS
jgi:hypothetical protein